MEIINLLVKTNILSNQELRQATMPSNSTVVPFSAGFSSLFSTYCTYHGCTSYLGGSVTTISSALTSLVTINRLSAGNGDDGDPDDDDEIDEDEDASDEEEDVVRMMAAAAVI